MNVAMDRRVYNIRKRRHMRGWFGVLKESGPELKIYHTPLTNKLRSNQNF